MLKGAVMGSLRRPIRIVVTMRFTTMLKRFVAVTQSIDRLIATIAAEIPTPPRTVTALLQIMT